jgi:TolB-like protein
MLSWAAAAATSAAVGVAWRATRAPRTIAIVPFDNETGLPELDRLAQAMTDALVARLTAASDGRYGIIGNAAILREARERRDLLLVARTLHAGYVVIGQLQRTPTGVRILAHLIRLPEQTHLWVTRIERPLDTGDLPADAADRITADFLKRL